MIRFSLIISIFFCVANIATAQIGLNTNFQPAIAAPLDLRLQTESVEELAAIPFPYDGLLTYVVAEEEFYVYSQGVWAAFATSSAGLNAFETWKIETNHPNSPFTEYMAAITGATGPAGIKGDKGDIGATGPAGVKGDKGDIGATGPAGIKGDKGDIGATGPAGIKGDKGDIGATGPAGVKGDKGDIGATGPAGIKGDKGDIGATGPAGVKGDKGDIGATGPAGVKGDKGDVGEKGEKGDAGTGGNTDFDGNRVIRRLPTVGTNMEFTTFSEYLEWLFIPPFVKPTISISQSPTTALVEVGTSTNYSISGNVNNPSVATLNNGNLTYFNVGFGNNTSYNHSYTFAPQTVQTISYRAQQNYISQDEKDTGTAYSATKTIRAAFPVFWGMSSTEYTSGNVPYNVFTKSLRLEGNFSATFSGDGFIYILIPKAWADYNLSKIIDHNGFNVTPSFTSYDVSITSTGLPNNYTQAYKLYKLNSLTSASGFTFQIQR